MLSSQHYAPTPAGAIPGEQGPGCQGSLPPHSHSVLTGKRPECGGLGPRTTPSLANLPQGTASRGSQSPRPHAGSGGQVQEDSILRSPLPLLWPAVPLDLTWLCREHRAGPCGRNLQALGQQRQSREETGWDRATEPGGGSALRPATTTHGDSRRENPPSASQTQALLCCNKHRAAGGEESTSPNKRLKTESP